MKTPPGWWSALGGPWCVSLWSGIIGVVFVLASFNWTVLYSPLSVGEAFMGEVIAAVICALLLWWAHAWWLSPARAGQRHRSWLAIGTFVLVGLVRIAVLYGTRELLGIAQPWNPLQMISTGGVYVVLLLCLVAVVVDSLRQHARTMQELRQAQLTFSRAAEVEAEEVESLQIAFVEDVVQQVGSMLRGMKGSAEASTVAADIQDISDRLMRTGSHSLEAGEVLNQAFTAPRSNVSVREVIAGICPAAPLLGPVIFEVLVFASTIRDFGASIAVVNLVLATLVLCCGNLLLGWLFRKLFIRRGQLLLLLAGYVVIALVAAGVVQGALYFLGTPRSLWFASLGYAIFMVLVCVIPSMRKQQAEAEAALEESLAQVATALGRARALAADQRSQLAHAMHGELQAEMTAAALTISQSIEKGESREFVDARIDELVALLATFLDNVHSPRRAQQLHDVIETWRLALDIDLDVDVAAERMLSDDADLNARVVDVVSEGLTNAVRHSAARAVQVHIRETEQGLLDVVLINAGHLREVVRGQGSQVLDERCEQWSLTNEPDGVHLSARLRRGSRVTCPS